MKSIKYIISISIALLYGTSFRSTACSYDVYSPSELNIFRLCDPEMLEQWHKGKRFQEDEKLQNCRLWQKATSPQIKTDEIQQVVYKSSLIQLRSLADGTFASDSVLCQNRFARWLSAPQHKTDLDFLLLAKEVEEIRRYMNDPWYYAYDGDEEHSRLQELCDMAQSSPDRRNASRYALQAIRLMFVLCDYKGCTDYWESTVSKLPDNILRKMAASYVGGAWEWLGDRNKAIGLYEEAEDIGALMNLSGRIGSNPDKLPEVARWEAVFNRFPNSPLFKVELQKEITAIESWNSKRFSDPTTYEQYLSFFKKAAADTRVKEPAMWFYAASFVHQLHGDMKKAGHYLALAEKAAGGADIKEYIRLYRFYLDAKTGNISDGFIYRNIRWIDTRIKAAVKGRTIYPENLNSNYPFEYWHDALRKIALGEICPQLIRAGRTIRALQLSNYVCNRITQLCPCFLRDYYSSYQRDTTCAFDQMRQICEYNPYDYKTDFFDMLDRLGSSTAARYTDRALHPLSPLDQLLNAGGYTDPDYLYEHVGTLYLRENNYAEAVKYLSKVSAEYQMRTNLVPYMKEDPFQYYEPYEDTSCSGTIDNNDYKLRFAREMFRLETEMKTADNPDLRANAMIRYAAGLRNSFGRCWALTQYFASEDSRSGFNYRFNSSWARKAYTKADRLVVRALREFKSPELAAQAHLKLKNFKTVVRDYPHTRAARLVHQQCDRYYDYAIHKF